MDAAVSARDVLAEIGHNEGAEGTWAKVANECLERASERLALERGLAGLFMERAAMADLMIAVVKR